MMLQNIYISNKCCSTTSFNADNINIDINIEMTNGKQPFHGSES